MNISKAQLALSGFNYQISFISCPGHAMRGIQ